MHVLPVKSCIYALCILSDHIGELQHKAVQTLKISQNAGCIVSFFPGRCFHCSAAAYNGDHR